MDEWRGLLRAERKRCKLSREKLAALAQVSVATVKAYESGPRHPKRPYFIAILDALKTDRGTRNRILAGADFTPDGLSLRYDMDALAFTIEEAAQEIEQYSWPAFLADEFGQVLTANSVAQLVWGVDLRDEFADPMDRHLISIATNPRFADRCLNWDEAVGTILATWRDHFRGGESLDEPTPYFARLTQRLLAGDPKYVARLGDLWQNAPPIKVKMRWSYRIVWDTPNVGIMRFHCFLSSANERDGYLFHDWIPTDAASWNTLSAIATN